MTSHKPLPILAASLLAVALGAGAVEAKSLVFCSEGSPETFNTMLTASGPSADVVRAIYNNLVQFQPGTTKVGPALAKSWEISPDGLTYTMHLREGVKWQSNARFTPTRTFNADDVIFSFERQWKDSNPFHAVGGGSYEYFSDMSFPDLLASIDKVDDMTVKFVLKHPHAPFLADLAMVFTIIQSKEYADTLLAAGAKDVIDDEPIGTGPFQLVNYKRDATIRYKAFKGYWGTAPKIDTLVFSINKDPAVRMAKLRANECQVSVYPNLADMPAIKADPDLQVMEQPGLNIGFLALNVTKKPFDDVRVRRALNMGIDKGSIIKTVYQGAGQAAKNLIPPTMWGYNDAVTDFSYDVGAAKKLLAEAGYADGFEMSLWAMPVQRPYNPDAKRIAEMMQSDLSELGIKANIVSYEWGEYRKRAQNGEADAVQLGWTGDNGDPDNFFTQLSSCAAARPGGSSTTKWCDKDFDALIEQAATTGDQAQRAKLYEQAQVKMHDAAPFVLIAHSIVAMPMRKSVTGYTMDPFGIHYFDTVDVK
jgi:dipeptide transport system substrate-binding protein